MKLKTFALALTLAMGAGLTVSAQAAEVIELWPNGTAKTEWQSCHFDAGRRIQ